MNNFNSWENTWADFRPTGKSNPVKANNCSANCQGEICKRLPFWLDHQPFWTYQCKCCGAYQFDKGKVDQEWGGIYD